MSFMDDAKDLAGEHEDQVNAGTDKAGELAEEKTGGKYDDQIEKGEDAIEKQLGTDDAAGQGDGGADRPR